jgi:tRNA threonylcarbamoyladenosine biosynthesis protein TsaB
MIAWGAAYTGRMPAPTPRLLAIDCATERLSVALVAGAQSWSAEEEGGARASLRLLPLAFELLARAGLAPCDLDAVAFGRGPGAFTGLRTACAVAQGWALGQGCPLLALDSLALVAEDALAQQPAAARGLWVAMDARMDEVYAAAYHHDGTRWCTRVEPALWTLPALAAAWRDAPPGCVAGSALAAFGDRLPLAGALRIETQRDRAGALARLARAARLQGGALDAADALPLYLRDKVALTTAERMAARAATPLR